MDWLITFLRFGIIAVLIYLLIAVVLILSQRPGPFQQDKGLDFDRIESGPEPMPPRRYQACDGVSLAYRHYGQGGPLVVVVHGSGAFGAAYDGLARDIAAMGATVLLPDFALIVGDRDEAFIAENYQPLMQDVTDKGQYFVLEGGCHLGISYDPQAKVIIEKFLND